MRHKSIRHATILALAGLWGVLFLQTSTKADLVLAGYDLFMTGLHGALLNGEPLSGVPLHTYDFGGTIGVKDVGLTDTIMQRMDTWDSTTPGNPISLRMDALQLVTTDPAFPNGDLGYITLDPSHTSGGTLTINADHTFQNHFDVYYEVHQGSLTGTIVDYGEITNITGSGTWQHPPPDTILISGVNYQLNGTSTANDFWPVGTVHHIAAGGAHHDVYPPPSVPEPGQLAASLVALLGVGGFVVRRKLNRV